MLALEQYLKNLGIEKLNAMQEESLAAFDYSRDFMLLSPTGSGKTLAFALLMLKLMEKAKQKGTSALVIVPTRELALQIEQVIKALTKDITLVCVYGGSDTRAERKKLEIVPNLIVGTPGRIIYHVDRNPDLLKDVKILVLDEFDKSLELGFHDQLDFILKACPNIKNQILTSATAIKEYPHFLKLNNPVSLNFLADSVLTPNLSYFQVQASSKMKLEYLFKLICKIGTEKVLIFCNHREAVDHIQRLLIGKGVECINYHGGLDQYDRELAIIKIKNGSEHILVTTDLGSRGLDIPEIKHVIHYQFPYKEEEFIHRNGRTGRNQSSGSVYGIFTPEDRFPEYFEDAQVLELDEFYPLPEPPAFKTLRISAGKKDKINKVDIVGFLHSLAKMEKEDVGIINLKEYESYVAVASDKASAIAKAGNNTKIKGKKVRLFTV